VREVRSQWSFEEEEVLVGGKPGNADAGGGALCRV